MKYSEKVADKLNDLLEKNYDAEKGYQFAEENVKDPDLKAFFKDRVKERYDFGHELKAEIRNFGQKPDKGSSVKGDIHRSWMNLKTAFSSNEEEAILEEAVRGEKAAIDDYNSAIEEANIPPSTENILLKQRNAIEKSLEQLKALERKES